MHHVYLRVSTDHQDEATQKTGVIEYMKAHGNPPMVFHTDRLSGASPWRSRKLAGLLEKCDEGDTIVTAEVSRIGRSTVDVLEFLQAAVKKRVGVIVTKSGLVVDQSLQSKITTTVLALAAEIEREFLRARTLEGMARAKALGVRMGRPPGATSAGKLEPHRAEVMRLINAAVPHTAIARIFGVSRGTVARFIEKQEITQP